MFSGAPPNAGRIGRVLLSGLVLLAGLGAGWISLQYSDDTICALINAGLFAVPFLLVAALRGRLPTAIAVAISLAWLIWGIGEFKLHFFSNRLALMDLYFLSEGANWSIVKRYPNVQAALAGWLGLSVLLLVWAGLQNRQHRALAPRVRIVCVALLAGWCAVAWGGRHQHTWEVFRDDADCGWEKVCGVMSRLVYSYSVFEFMAPLPGSEPAQFLAAQATLPTLPVRLAKALPDVVVWLHESTLDPAQYLLDDAQLPALPMFARSAQTHAAGLLRVHTYGGKTWLTEFSLLTGLLPADFGARSSLVFNSVAPLVTSTLVRRFAAAGYDTVALMPTPKKFYGAARTYAAVGFERVLTLRDFPEYDHLPGDEWDIADSARLAEAAGTLLREQRRTRPERPLFLYLLSVKEHSPYSARTPVAFGLDRAGTAPTLAAKLSDYIQRLQRLDAALRDLEQALLNSPRKTLWAYFGDHQAYFEEAQPAYRHDLPQPELVTQYQLRSNYALPPIESPALLDIALLPSLIVDSAGIESDAYFSAQSVMRRLCAGQIGDCPDAALVQSYKAYLYGVELALFGMPVVAAHTP